MQPKQQFRRGQRRCAARSRTIARDLARFCMHLQHCASSRNVGGLLKPQPASACVCLRLPASGGALLETFSQCAGANAARATLMTECGNAGLSTILSGGRLFLGGGRGGAAALGEVLLNNQGCCICQGVLMRLEYEYEYECECESKSARVRA